MPKKLIVNADDYGHGKKLSEGIRQAHLQGIVTSTTAMMNWPDAVSDLPLAVRDCPNLGLGVHLVLTSGKPLLPAAQVPSLVDANGLFRRPDPFIAALPQLTMAEVSAEWHAQVALFEQVTGRTPDHLDSHHHVSYTSPTLFECMLNLAAEFDCPIRLPYTDPAAGHASDYLWTSDPENDYAHVMESLKRHSHTYPQVFFSSFYDEGATLNALTQLIERMAADTEHDTFELMCHPAFPDDFLRKVSDYNDMRGEELKILTDARVKALLAKNAIDLISFAGL